MMKSKQIQRQQMVLVADDQEINRDALEVILADDYEVITAENSGQALELMRAHEKELSLVLLDLMMPVMNGYDVLKTVHADETLCRIPVIVMTADKGAELEALQLGAADFITKPFDLHEVIRARVGRMIELSEGRKLISTAEKDPLTGLYSRNFFFEYANRLFRYHPDTKMDAVVINIEQFHSVNAMHGREFGDSVLRAIGGSIREFLQTAEGLASRFDADRFLIYCSHQADYWAVLDRFQEQVRALSPNVLIHLRMGVKNWQEQVPPVVLFDQARAACNMVRGDYQNPLMVYNEDMLKKEMLNQRLLNDLRAALEEGQFQVYFQPKYDIQCDPPRLRSAEALIRWKHPELGMVSPGAFIPLFEGNGLISLVDSYVWKETAKQVAAWRKKYRFTLPVSVNLSRADLFDPALTDRKGVSRMDTTNHKQYLNIFGAWALSFGCSVGWGAFVMPGTTFLPIAGPVGTAIGLGLGGLVMLVLAVNFHYLMNRFPDCGGIYTYTQKAFGYDHGFLSAWFLILTYIAIIWANATALPLIARTVLGDLFRFGYLYQIAGYQIYVGEILLSAFALAIATFVCFFRKLSAWTQVLLAGILFAGVVICFAAAASSGHCAGTMTPAYAPDKEPVSGVFTVFALTPWAFVGFESITHSAEEARFSLKRSFRIMLVAVFTAAIC